ncbi:MAG TPA: class I SAM-dependent methyltransferase [Bacteroidia bacterium]|nr:class I SAM-dependent methyltransferase [Bacteroidia bacterium]
MKITLVLCTSDRPEAFALAEKYIKRQTVQPFEVLIFDDGNVPVKPTIGRHIFCPECRGGTSMINKLKIAFSPGFIQGDIVICWEDDDLYAPNWIETCAKNLGDGRCDLFGEGRAIYYNVRDRWWFEHANMSHASLCSTAFTKRLFPLVLRLCNDANPFLDDRLWKNAPANRKRLLDPMQRGGKRLVVGIKAMPGKVGYGGGHQKVDRNAKPDPDGAKLREFIGDDAALYEEFWSQYVPPMNLKVPAHTDVGRVHGPKWMKWLAHLVDQPNITGMEIGTFKGESAEFLAENVFTHETARYICVDPFEAGNPEHVVGGIDCSQNEKIARELLAKFKPVQVVKDFSQNFLRRFVGELDFLYVDGLHSSMGCLRDMVLGFEALKVGGVMVVDDYPWEVLPKETDRPKIAVDAFMKCYAEEIELLATPGWQVALKRIK